MNTMNNAKVIKTIEQQALKKYLEKLLQSSMRKIILFSIFSQTGAPNLSDPKTLILIDSPDVLCSLNSGAVLN